MSLFRGYKNMGVGVDFIFNFVYHTKHDVNKSKTVEKAVRVISKRFYFCPL